MSLIISLQFLYDIENRKVLLNVKKTEDVLELLENYVFADYSICAGKVIEALESTIFEGKLLPKAMTIDNGPEFTGSPVRSRLSDWFIRAWSWIG